MKTILLILGMLALVPPVTDIQVLRMVDIRSDRLFEAVKEHPISLPYVDCGRPQKFRLYVIPQGAPLELEHWLLGAPTALLDGEPIGPFLPAGNWQGVFSWQLHCRGGRGEFIINLPVWMKNYAPFLMYTIELHEDLDL